MTEMKRQSRRPTRARSRTISHAPGRMNGLEAEYATLLDARVERGELFGYQFEAIKLRLADETWYAPDFFVLLADGQIEFHEVKGFWRDDARVKFKVAAERFAWARFVAVTKRPSKAGGGWNEERMK